MNTKSFSEKMKEFRIMRGITQKELAQKANVAPATISAYENGAKSPTLDNALSIANVLNMPIDDLRGGETSSGMTYADIFRVLLSFVDSLNADIVEYQDIAYHKCNAIVFHNQTINKMIGNIRDIKKVLGNTEAEKELYKLWVESKIKEYAQHNVFSDDSVTGINDPETLPQF